MNFLNRLSKNTRYQISLNCLQCKPTCPLADKRRDITKLIVAFYNFVNAPNRFSKILRCKTFRIKFSMPVVAFMVRVNKEQATINYFRSIVDKTKWGQIIRIIRDIGVQDNCSDTSKRMNNNLITIIQIFQILMYVNFKIIGLKWQD